MFKAWRESYRKSKDEMTKALNNGLDMKTAAIVLKYETRAPKTDEELAESAWAFERAKAAGLTVYPKW
jgi:hypothetical protein